MSLDQTITEAVARAVRAELDRILTAADRAAHIRADDRLLVTEPEAARLLGISSTWLRDLRLAGKVTPHRRSRPILYARDSLQDIAELLAQD